jgi:hypothetical protein
MIIDKNKKPRLEARLLKLINQLTQIPTSSKSCSEGFGWLKIDGHRYEYSYYDGYKKYQNLP